MRVLVIDAVAAVIDLVAAKAHLKVDSGDEDDLIKGFVAGATDLVAEWTQRSIGKQLLEALFTGLEADRTVRLPAPPIAELVSISWRSADRAIYQGDLQDVELVGADVVAIGEPPWSGLDLGPDALRIRYRAGYEKVPDSIRAAILLMTGFLYHNRGAKTAEPPAAVAVLIQPFKVYA